MDLVPDIGEAARFLSALCGKELPAFRTFADSDATTATGLTGNLAGTLDQHAVELAYRNGNGAGVFAIVNSTNGDGFGKDNVTNIRALFVDFDGPDKPFALEPSIVVQSGGGRHAYWLVYSGEDLTTFGPAQKQLARFYASDPRVFDLPRVMRVPGFWWRKADPPVMVRILECRPDIRYTIADVLEAHPVEMPAAPLPRPLVMRSSDHPLSQRVYRASRYLAKLPGGVSGSDGHGDTWKAALTVVRGFDLPPSVAIELLRAEYNPRCSPPWSERELEHKVESASADGQVPIGYLLDQPGFESRIARSVPSHDMAAAIDADPPTDETPPVEAYADEEYGPRISPIEEMERRLLASIAGHPHLILRVYEALGSNVSRMSTETHRDIFGALVGLATTDRPATLAAIAHGFTVRAAKEPRFAQGASVARDLISYRTDDLDIEAELRFIGTAYGYQDARRQIPDIAFYESRHAPLDDLASAYEDYARRLRDAATSLKPLEEAQLAIHLDDALAALDEDADDMDDWLIEGLIGRRSVGMLAGRPQVGKSALTVQLALCLANGRDVLNRRVAPTRTLYLIAEGSRTQFLWRVRTACRAMSIKAPSGPWFMQADNADVFEIGRPGFESVIATTKPDLVVLDTVFKFAPGCNENHADEWRTRVYRPLFLMSLKYNCSFLTLHHINKGGEPGGSGSAQDVAGTYAMYGDTDFFLRLSANDEQGNMTLHVDKARGRPKTTLPLVFDAQSACFSHGRIDAPRGAEAELRPGIVRAVVDAKHGFNGGYVSKRHILSRLKETSTQPLTDSTLTAILSGMVKDSMLEREGQAYRVPLDQKVLSFGPREETR